MPEQQLPRHVGIIMDGNGRWAKRRGLPRTAGHRQGAEAFRKLARHAEKRGIGHLTVYSFSTENWNRPSDEVATIMDLLRRYLGEAEKLVGETARLKVLGDIAPLDQDLKDAIQRLEEGSRHHTGMYLNIALNYGGRDEILHGAKELLRRYSRGEIGNIDSLTEADFASCLYTAGQPDVDLVIRTSGEMRTSNFLLWQSAYAEYVFPDTLFPDFTPALFDKALAEYAKRDRRMGGL